MAANASCTENVTFTPTAIGTVSGSLIFKESATTELKLVMLTGAGSGTANSPITLTPARLTFSGSQVVGTAGVPQSVVVKNTGTTGLTISFSASGGYLESSPLSGGCGTTLAGGASCTINVQFSPPTTGIITGGVSANYAGANSPQVVSLSGTSIHEVTVSPSSLAFSSQLVGTTSLSKTLVVTNHASSTVTVSSVASSSNFTETNTCAGGIAPGKSCTISVGFSPAEGGSFFGAVIITDSAANSPQIVNLSGTSPKVPRFAYVTNSSEKSLSIYSVNVSTGQLRPNGYILEAAIPQSVALDPSGKFAFVANSDSTVSAYSVNASTGMPTAVAGSPFAAGERSGSVTIHPSGKFVYVTNENSSDVSSYSINATSGVLSPILGSPFAAGYGAACMAIDPLGKFAYVGNAFNSPSDISAYTINLTTGALTPVAGSPFPTGLTPLSMTVAPSGRFLYVAALDNNAISVYNINATTGSLIPISGSPFAAGSSPMSIILDPRGRFAYVANSASNNISVYTVNASAGTLTPIIGSPFMAGKSPNVATMDSTGNFLYVGNGTSNEVWTYSINGSTGSLALLNTVRTRQGPASISLSRGNTPVTYTPRFAYVANNGSNNVSAYTIDDDIGTLVSITGSPFATGSSPQKIITDPSGRFAYVANNGSNNISAYAINASLGSLTQVTGSPFAAGTSPSSVAVDPGGRFAYVANSGSNNISAYAIGASTGVLTEITGSPFTAGGIPFSNPIDIVVDPSGRFAYLTNDSLVGDPGGIWAYTINPSTGALTTIAGSPFTTYLDYPAAMAVVPSGKFVYVTNKSNNTDVVFVIDATTGALTPIGSPLSEVPVPLAVTIDPSGRFVYVADYSSNVLDIYSVDPNTGILTEMGYIGAVSGPFSVAVDASGTFVFAATYGTNDIHVYTGDPSTFSLHGINGSPFAAGTGPISITTTGETH